tara:strand:+ start:6312 stop:6746 length:435 start_codon:yes stop_codon:yes gene_type:complete
VKVDAHKVLIYATWERRLLVFDEPDFPDVLLQVPGGTVEPGEEPDEAACREFREETGITVSGELRLLSVEDYRFGQAGIITCHRRHHFHLELVGPFPEEWSHWEETPFSGGPPIRFRLFWMPLPAAQRELGYGMQSPVPFLMPP